MIRISESAFTLVEIMVTMLIVGMIALAGSQVSFSRNINDQNREHLLNDVVSMINTPRIDMLIGRGVSVAGTIRNPDFATLHITRDVMEVGYFSGTLAAYTPIGSGASLARPFYGDQFYDIASITLHNRTTGTWDPITDISIIFWGGDITYSGASLPAGSEIQMRVGYKGRYSDITFDRRT